MSEVQKPKNRWRKLELDEVIEEDDFYITWTSHDNDYEIKKSYPRWHTAELRVMYHNHIGLTVKQANELYSLATDRVWRKEPKGYNGGIRLDQLERKLDPEL